MKKVLFFDIDGTLLNSELKMPEGVKRELKRLKEAGHYLFVASGRPLAFISNQIIEAGFNGFVLCNGAHVELNHEIIYENRIPYEKVNDLMKMLESVDCEYDFETVTDCYIDPSYKDFIEFFKVCDIRHEKLITSFDKEEVMHGGSSHRQYRERNMRWSYDIIGSFTATSIFMEGAFECI